jgi:hypothetical protein
MASSRYELCAMARRNPIVDRRVRILVHKQQQAPASAAARLQAYVRLNKHKSRMEALRAAVALMDASHDEAGILARCAVNQECSICLTGFNYQTLMPFTAPCSNMPLCEECCDKYALSKACCLCGADHFDRSVWFAKEDRRV